MGGKMRRKWKCGRWEGATDGGLDANSQLSLAEPIQTGMRAFPQVGAAWTLGEAASQRPSTREGDRDQGRWGLALGMGTGQLPRSKAHHHSHHSSRSSTTQYVRPDSLPSALCPLPVCLIGWRRPASIGLSTVDHGRYQLTLLLLQLQRIPSSLAYSLMALGSCGFALRAEVVSHKSVTRAPAQAGQVSPSCSCPSVPSHPQCMPHRHFTNLNSVGRSVIVNHQSHS